MNQIQANQEILFFYNNPNGRGQKGWRQGLVKESQNKYIIMFDLNRCGYRKFLRSCMKNVTIQ
jgi:hypothetical protein